MNNNIYYVYLHFKKGTNDIFYVGKGKGRRAYWSTGRNRHWKFTANKYGFDVKIFKDNLSEQDAFELEKKLISDFGKNNLCNYTDGGEGTSGVKRDKKVIEIVRNKLRGRVFSPETIEKMRESARIRSRNPDYQKKRTEKLIGKKHSEEHKEKIRLAGIGRKLSKESKNKISEFHKGKKKNKDAVLKMAESKSKAVFCLNNNTKYKSQSEAARLLNLSQSKISDVVFGRIKETKGFIFRSVIDNETS